MKYTTTDELEHFSFAEAYIADVQVTGGFFHMTLSNVTILPENEVIDQAAWNEAIRSFADGSVYALKQEGENYIFEIDAPDEEEYVLAVSGTHNTASWDRFLNK